MHAMVYVRVCVCVVNVCCVYVYVVQLVHVCVSFSNYFTNLLYVWG